MKNMLFDEIIKNLEFMRKHLYEVDSVEGYCRSCRVSEEVIKSLHEDKDFEYHLADNMIVIYTYLIDIISKTSSIDKCVEYIDYLIEEIKEAEINE